MAGSNETVKGAGFRIGRLFFNDGRCEFSGSGAPTNGTSGTGVGFAGPGSVYTRLSNGAQYTNTNTKASPTWTLVGTVTAGTITATELASAAVTSVKLDPKVLQFASIALSSVQLKALNSTPVQVIASPGTGKYILVHRAALAFTGTATQYTSGGVVSLVDHGTHNAVHTGGVPAATVQSASSSLTDLGGLAGANGNVRPAATAVDVEAATADFATGTGTARVQVWYSVVALTD